MEMPGSDFYRTYHLSGHVLHHWYSAAVSALDSVELTKQKRKLPHSQVYRKLPHPDECHDERVKKISPIRSYLDPGQVSLPVAITALYLSYQKPFLYHPRV